MAPCKPISIAADLPKKFPTKAATLFIYGILSPRIIRIGRSHSPYCDPIPLTYKLEEVILEPQIGSVGG